VERSEERADRRPWGDDSLTESRAFVGRNCLVPSLQPLAPDPFILRVVVRIEADVFRREVSRPKPRRRLAFFENEHDARVSITGD
jgi:hypothetical protein